MIQLWKRLRLRRTAMVSLTIAGLLVVSPLSASEVLKPRSLPRTHPMMRPSGKDHGHKGDPKFSGDSNFKGETYNATLINGKHVIPSNSNKLPTMEQMNIYSCAKKRGKTGGLCDRWSEAEKSYDAAAKVFGIPAPVLICITKIESGFRPGQTSSAGARGLTQFMPPTAKYFEGLLSERPEYSKAWEEYRELDGTQKKSSAFNASNITSNDLNQFDVQIFATAMYFRHELSQVEDSLSDRIQGDPNGLRKVWRYLAISYNGGGKRARTYMKNGLKSKVGIPKESKDYVDKLDKCLDEAGEARYSQFSGGQQ